MALKTWKNMIMVLGGSRKKSEKEKGGQWGSVFHNKFGSTEPIPGKKISA